MISSAARRHLIVSGCLLLGSIALYALGVVVIRSTDSALAELSASVAQAQLQASSQEATARFARTLSTERAELESRFVDDEDLVSFLSEIEAVGARSGARVTIDSVGEEKALMPGAAAPKKGKEKESTGSFYKTVALSLSVEGSWDAVMRFVGMIEMMPYGMSLEHVHLEHSSRESSEWTLLIKAVFAATGSVDAAALP